MKKSLPVGLEQWWLFQRFDCQHPLGCLHSSGTPLPILSSDLWDPGLHTVLLQLGKTLIHKTTPHSQKGRKILKNPNKP